MIRKCYDPAVADCILRFKEHKDQNRLEYEIFIEKKKQAKDLTFYMVKKKVEIDEESYKEFKKEYNSVNGNYDKMSKSLLDNFRSNILPQIEINRTIASKNIEKYKKLRLAFDYFLGEKDILACIKKYLVKYTMFDLCYLNSQSDFLQYLKDIENGLIKLTCDL